MPYIDTKDVATMRKNIRAALPEYVISVTKRHHSGVDVRIMQGPIVGVKGVNVYWFKDHFSPEKENRPDVIAIVETILAEIRKVKTPKTMSEDSDYGSIPNFYYDVAFGKWDKDYVCTDPEAEDNLQVKQAFETIKYEQERRARLAQWRAERERLSAPVPTLRLVEGAA